MFNLKVTSLKIENSTRKFINTWKEKDVVMNPNVNYAVFLTLLGLTLSLPAIPSFTMNFIYAQPGVETNRPNILKVVEANKIIGTQSTQETPNGKIVRCAGNIGKLFMPKTICAGTSENDTIVASPSGGEIHAQGGNDKVQGLLGSEVTFGNDGNDTIQAGNGSASIFGNDGNDTLVGEIGPNILTGNGGSMLDGGDGNDRLIGGIHHDVLIGGHGLDTFSCSGKDDIVIDFNPSEDHISGNCIIA